MIIGFKSFVSRQCLFSCYLVVFGDPGGDINSKWHVARTSLFHVLNTEEVKGNKEYDGSTLIVLRIQGE